MATYNPPLHFNSVFNTTDYTTTNSSSVSQSDADSKYLKKVGSEAISNATLTTFNGQARVKFDFTLYRNLIFPNYFG